MPGDDYEETFATQVERIRASGALGRSHGLRKLFDYLADHSRAGDPPREIDVAVAVFGNKAAADLSGDASVRVYVHRLRRKLDEFYSGAGATQSMRLTLPRGEYRLALEPVGQHANVAPPDSGSPHPLRTSRSRTTPWVVAGIVAVLAVNLGAWLILALDSSAEDPLQRIREYPMWSSLAADARPTVVVLGDYYIFGDTEETPDVQRLVREFSVNSRTDLDEHLMRHPELIGRYVDLDLHYVPIGTAVALRDVLPLLQQTVRGWNRTRVITASSLAPGMLKSHNIVYVGYLSGLRLLQEPVFAGSALQTGSTYDELIDPRNSRHYVSEAGQATEDRLHRDYSYVASFAGPSGNRIIIVAGTRDIGVMHAAEAVTTAAALEALHERLQDAGSFEALYEVKGLGRTHLQGKALLVERRTPADRRPQ